MSRPDITAVELRALFHYEPTTGIFTRRVAMGNAFPAGQQAGSRGARCYICMFVKGKSYLAHRLAWLYTMGAWPEGSVDHIDGVTDNNRIENLRDVPQSLNLQNQKRCHKNSKSGFLGVHRNGLGWAAHITTNKVKRHLGTFKTAELASEAYLAAKRTLHETNTL